MTELQYLVDSYIQSFEAKVIGIHPEANGVILDTTTFYPGGGGQPADTGSLTYDGDNFSLKSAKRIQGEIIHVFLVFPNVPQSEEVSRYWLRYVSDIPEIIYATGPSVSYAGDETYRTKGVQPFYTNLWFKPTAEEKVKELIRGIEEFGENKEGPSTTE